MHSKIFRWSCTLLMIIFGALFFSNDFGLIDLHKSAIILELGIDVEGDEFSVTAQISTPSSAESSSSFTEVDGKGKTVAEALNDINAKTGYFPKLTFCNLILLGEGCQAHNVFSVLNHFYTNDNAELTSLVAMCKGKAKEVLARPTPIEGKTSIFIQRVLPEELKKSGNSAIINLKRFAESAYNPSKASYMPYIEMQPAPGSQGGQGGGGQGEQSSGSTPGGTGGAGGQSPSQQTGTITCNKTAYFREGQFCGVLDEAQSLALYFVKEDLRHVVLGVEQEGVAYALGMKSIHGNVFVKMKEEQPQLILQLYAKVKILSSAAERSPSTIQKERAVPQQLIEACKGQVQKNFEELLTAIQKSKCDLLEVQTNLYRFYPNYYKVHSQDALSQMKVNYEIDIVSVI